MGLEIITPYRLVLVWVFPAGMVPDLKTVPRLLGFSWE